jgi:hypothetical protein
MLIHCTKKLILKLPESIEAKGQQLVSNVTPLHGIGSWHANLLLIQRRQCVIFVHDSTRYAMIIPSLRKADFTKLDYHFQDVFINSLIKAGLPFELVERATEWLTPLTFDIVCNRSVQGTMRLMAEDVEWGLIYDHQSINELLPYSRSAELSNRPCNIKGQKDCIWPIKAMQQLLETLPEL